MKVSSVVAVAGLVTTGCAPIQVPTVAAPTVEVREQVAPAVDVLRCYRALHEFIDTDVPRLIVVRSFMNVSGLPAGGGSGFAGPGDFTDPLFMQMQAIASASLRIVRADQLQQAKDSDGDDFTQAPQLDGSISYYAGPGSTSRTDQGQLIHRQFGATSTESQSSTSHSIFGTLRLSDRGVLHSNAGVGFEAIARADTKASDLDVAVAGLRFSRSARAEYVVPIYSIVRDSAGYGLAAVYGKRYFLPTARACWGSEKALNFERSEAQNSKEFLQKWRATGLAVRNLLLQRALAAAGHPVKLTAALDDATKKAVSAAGIALDESAPENAALELLETRASLQHLEANRHLAAIVSNHGEATIRFSPKSLPTVSVDEGQPTTETSFRLAAGMHNFRFLVFPGIVTTRSILVPPGTNQIVDVPSLPPSGRLAA